MRNGLTRRWKSPSVRRTRLRPKADKAQANIPKKKVRQTVIDPDNGKKTSNLTLRTRKSRPPNCPSPVRDPAICRGTGKVHKEIRETEQDNVGVESARKSEGRVETGAYLVRRAIAATN